VRKLYQNLFGFDGVFCPLVRSSVGALSEFCEFWQRTGSWVPLVYWSPACRDYPTTLPRNGWFANHSESLICCSYVICAFTYHIVELVFVLSYIQSRVWGSIEYSGTQCGDYYLIPRRLTTLIGRKILDSAVDEVSEALSMHVAPSAIQIVMVPVGVTILLGLHNPPRSWISTVGPSLPGFTIAPCVEFLLCYRIVQAAEVYYSRQSQSLRYVYAFIHLHLSCPTHL
jgi:hypothetical protein